MAVNNITTQNWYAVYVKASQNNGNSVVDPSALFDASTGLITEADGDVFQVTGDTVVFVKAGETAKNDNVTETNDSETNETIEKLRAEIANLEAQKDSNEKQLENLDKKIEGLKAEAQAEIDKAIQENENLTKEQEAAASQVIAEQLKKYTDADGEMTYDDFQKNTSAALGTLDSQYNTKMQNTFTKLMTAENKLQTLDTYLQTFSTLNQRNKELTTQIEEKNAELNTAMQTENATQDVAGNDLVGFELLNSENHLFFGLKDNSGKTQVSDNDEDGEQRLKEILALFKDKNSANLNTDKAVNEALGFNIDERLNEHTEDVALIRENLTSTWLTLGVDREKLKEVINENKNEVDDEAKELSVKFAESKQLEEQEQLEAEKNQSELDLKKEARKAELIVANPDMTKSEIEAILAEEFPPVEEPKEK